MHTFLLCIATASVGIQAGWQRMPEGGMQYIIQLDPETLQSLREGAELESDIPPSAGEVRSYKILVGRSSSRVRRRLPPKAAAPQVLSPDLGGKPLPAVRRCSWNRRARPRPPSRNPKPRRKSRRSSRPGRGSR